jgi:hypothetical protein
LKNSLSGKAPVGALLGATEPISELPTYPAQNLTVSGFGVFQQYRPNADKRWPLIKGSRITWLSALFRCAAFAFGLLGSSLLRDAFHFLDNVFGQVRFPCFAIPAFVDLGLYFSLYQKLSELSSLGFGFNSHR